MTKISVHAIQTFPACNLNSDESGAVKTMMFGGTNRMRISSQSWKASVRETFHNGGDATLYATRTKRSPHLIIERALELNTELDRTDAEKFWEKVMSSILKSKKSEARARKKKDFKAQEAERERAERANNGGTTEVETAEEILSDALFTVSDAQVDAAAHVVLSAMAGKIADKDIKVKVIEALSGGVSGEQALFGRFFADEKKLCIDGVTNVAHAIGIIPMP
jgi:CRISPR system Cascade subunit CasC